jgi:hypothetical protein
VALLFEQDPTLTQDKLVAALQGGSRRFQGYVPYDYQMGAGALDIEEAVAAVVEAQAEGPMAPDPTKSWVTLSAGYARPDPTWPIVGDVELRTTSGAPADGFDANALTLATTAAVVVAPLTRVGPGLWRFSVAGADGSGGAVLHATVSYGGALIADRTLPIGGDVWATRSVGSARGGCAVATRSGSSSAPLSVLLGIGAMAARVRRRTRR